MVMKSLVRHDAILTSGVEPPGFRSWVGIEVWHVGLDIEQWRAVENIDVGHVQNPALLSQKPDHGHSYGVGATGGARCEEPVLLRVPVGYDVRLEPSDPIQPVDQPDSFEACDVIQRGSKGFVDENLALSTLCIAGLNGGARRLDEGTTDDPYYP